jgi:hypothetical protein
MHRHHGAALSQISGRHIAIATVVSGPDKDRDPATVGSPGADCRQRHGMASPVHGCIEVTLIRPVHPPVLVGGQNWFHAGKANCRSVVITHCDRHDQS